MTPHYLLGTKKILVKYVDGIEKEKLSCCQCGWRGTAAGAETRGGWEERELMCPSCDSLLGMVSEQLFGEDLSKRATSMEVGDGYYLKS